MEPDSRQVINVLQAGRAVAALGVVVAHASTAAGGFVHQLRAQQFLYSGHLGVDFFFVLSGFIIYYSTVEKHHTPAVYAWARFRRVYLPYWPVGIAVALVYVAVPQISRGDHSWDWLATLTLAPVGAPALPVAWTLQHEVLFYLLFGIFFFTRTLWFGLALWTVAIIAFADRAIPFATVNLEFMTGILCAVLYRQRIGHWLLFPVAAALIGLWLWQSDVNGHSPLVGLALGCIILQLALMEQRGLFSVPAWLVLLGNGSYAIYLVHNWTISVVARMVPAQWLVIFASGIAASVVAGMLYYLLVERPMLRAARRRRQRRPLLPSSA